MKLTQEQIRELKIRVASSCQWCRRGQILSTDGTTHLEMPTFAQHECEGILEGAPMTSDEIRKIDIGMKNSITELLRELTAQIARANELDTLVARRQDEGTIPGTHLYSIYYHWDGLDRERRILAFTAEDALTMFRQSQKVTGAPSGYETIALADDQNDSEGDVVT